MIYYVEDDQNIRELTMYALRQAGFKVRGFSHANEFFAACAEDLPELVLLDIMLPDVSGIEILRQLRATPKTQHLPVMMLTAKDSEFDRVQGLDSGADDYLGKPYGMMELVSRVKALLRRAQRPAATSGDELRLDIIAIDKAARTVFVAEEEVTLTLKEFELLRVLMENEGHVLSRSQLLESVWDITYMGETRTVDVHVQTLRQKLGRAYPGAEGLIATVRGVGYVFKTAN